MNLIINRLKDKYSLINFYLQIICNALKFDAIKMFFKEHFNALSLIMFFFFKITLVIKRVNRCFILIFLFFRIEIFFILYIKHIV